MSKNQKDWTDPKTGLTWYFKTKAGLNQYQAEEWAKTQGKRLPTKEEWEIAEKHGIRQKFNLNWDRWFWSSSVFPGSPDVACVFGGGNGDVGYGYRYNDSKYGTALCVSPAVAGVPEVDLQDVKLLGGVKHDVDKVRLDLLPFEQLEEVAAVLTFGSKKYDEENWRKGFTYKRLFGAALRHIFAFVRGENQDPESGLSHLAHAVCCLLFLMWMVKYRKDLDNRFVNPNVTESKGETKNGI